MRIAFVSRAFPPTIGGIEKQNADLAEALSKHCSITLIANRLGKKFLPLFLPYAFIRLLIIAKRCDAIILGDAVLSPIGALAQALSKTPCFCIVHGLDISFDLRFYQWLVVNRALKKMKAIYTVGNATRELAIVKGLNPSSIKFIANGVNFEAKPPINCPDLAKKIQKPFCLSLGRLVKRKGVTWFLDHVASHLPNNIAYVIAGTGPEQAAIEQRLKLHPNVIFLGEVSEHQKTWLFQNSLCFVQPNIAIKNDIEGFGLVVLEACTQGTLVVASRIEGLQDAIKHEKNGYLVESGNAQAFIDTITQIYQLSHRQYQNTQDCFSRYTLGHYHWENIAKQYLDAIKSVS